MSVENKYINKIFLTKRFQDYKGKKHFPFISNFLYNTKTMLLSDEPIFEQNPQISLIYDIHSLGEEKTLLLKTLLPVYDKNVFQKEGAIILAHLFNPFIIKKNSEEFGWDILKQVSHLLVSLNTLVYNFEYCCNVIEMLYPYEESNTDLYERKNLVVEIILLTYFLIEQLLPPREKIAGCHEKEKFLLLRNAEQRCFTFLFKLKLTPFNVDGIIKEICFKEFDLSLIMNNLYPQKQITPHVLYVRYTLNLRKALNEEVIKKRITSFIQVYCIFYFNGIKKTRDAAYIKSILTIKKTNEVDPTLNSSLIDLLPRVVSTDLYLPNFKPNARTVLFTKTQIFPESFFLTDYYKEKIKPNYDN